MLQGLNVGESPPPQMQTSVLFWGFFFSFMSISVIAGPDYLQGPASRPRCVGLEPQASW